MASLPPALPSLQCVRSGAGCPQAQVGVLPACSATPTAFNGGPGTLMSCEQRLAWHALVGCPAVREGRRCLDLRLVRLLLR